MTSFSEPTRVQDLLRGFPCPWGVAGGWALDLFLNRVTREHHDIEIAIFRADQLALQEYLFQRDWSMQYVRDHNFHPWSRGDKLELPIHEVWCRRSGGDLKQLEV